MNDIFRNRLNEELLRSERRRTVILIIFFAIALVFRLLETYIIQADDETRVLKSFKTLWVFPLVILLFELTSFLFINRRIKSGNFHIPAFAQYLNTAVETSIPSGFFLFTAYHNPNYNFLTSPILNIYFLFIILSTLRLNFRLSLFCGLLAATSYTLIAVYVNHQFFPSDVARVILFVLAGVAAGLVANQIKKGINNSLNELDKQQQVARLFGRQVSKEVAQKMMEKEGALESRRMKVAILFTDIRNFTGFAAGKTPEEIVHYQNAFFSIVVDVVEKHHGIVNQFLGDGCMITFGAPVEMENPSQQAVSAAMALLTELKKRIVAGRIPKTEIGIGIHTGDAVTGNIGTSVREQYSITGNVVILAARIEQLNKEFQTQLLISSDVYNAISKENLQTSLMGNIMLKGWHEPMEIYKLA